MLLQKVQQRAEDIEAELVTVQLFASVTVTVYVPFDKDDIFCKVEPLLQT